MSTSDRKPKSIRLDGDLDAAVQAVASREGVSWNEAARRLLKWAVKGSPKPEGWH